MPQMNEKVAKAWQRLGTISGVARAVNLSRSAVRARLKKLGLYDERPLFAGRVAPIEEEVRPLPEPGKVKRYFLTSAQNNTRVATRIFDNVLALVEYRDAEFIVGTLTYNKASYGAKAVKRGKGPALSDKEEMWYDPEIEEYINDNRIQLAPGLVWCGEMNILPTAVRPLQGLERYTERRSGIFPHVKVQMQSVASGKHEPTKFNFTTGTITKRNYIQKKEGLKADFHHCYGGLIVEVDSDGNWFVRQVIADSKGVICDKDLRVDDGVVTEGNRVKAITWGDIHTASIDKKIAELCWGTEGMMDALQPEYQFMHDVLDFRARSGHYAKKGLIHDRFRAFTQGHDSVEKEVRGVADFLDETSREDCKTIVVNSNHDNFMMEWLRIADYRYDPINAVYFLTAQLHVYGSIADAPDEYVNLLRWAVERFNGQRKDTRFLDEDESFVLLGIEYGLHGEHGPNGARGTVTGLARMGRKMNRGHEHSAGIFEDVWTGGLTGENDQGYNIGPSSWSPSHIVTYMNGKQAIYTMWGGKWCV